MSRPVFIRKRKIWQSLRWKTAYGDGRSMYWCAFGLPVILSILICIGNGVYPFGENCILHIDMYHQYEPFFTEFMDKLKNGENLMYSFRLGIGSDFVSLFAYYLASPFNWLLILCPSSYVIEFMTILILLKIGLCGASFEVYIWNHFENNDFSSVIFAAFYALSGYMAAYSWNIMWLDCLVFAPLTVLGLEKLMKDGKSRLYCLSLAAAILSNFYIAIMLCIFLALYALVVIWESLSGRKERCMAFFWFTVHSLLAGGMGAALILPEAIMLSYSGSAGISFPDTMEWYFDLVSMLARHCIDVKVYTGRDHWPNLYCGAAVFLFLVLYLCNRKISRKRKAGYMAFVLFFWLSFSNNFLDFIWHGMHFPDSLPGRQSFLYIFLLLIMAYETYHYWKGNTWQEVLLGVAVSMAVLLIAEYTVDSGMVTGNNLLATRILILLYGILLILRMIEKKVLRKFVHCTLAFLAVFELFVNINLTGFSTTSRSSYTKNWESVKCLLTQIEAKDSEPFYRVEEMERLTKNDALVYGYSSATQFSSLMNIGVSRFYRKMGMEGGKNFYSYSGATPLPSAMLSVKYLISGSPYEESPLQTLAAEDGKNYIYQNKYTLPFGFMIEKDLEEKWNPKSGAPITNLNRLAAVLGAEEEMFQPFGGQVEVRADKTVINVLEDGCLYGTYEDTSVTNITVTNGERVRKFNKCDHGYILDLGWCKAGDVVEIENSSNVSNFKVKAYVLNMDAFLQAYATLNKQTFEIDEFSDTMVRGSIHADKDGSLLFSVPKEAGWHIYVDGTETEGESFMNSLIEIPVTEGEHYIVMRYATPDLHSGIMFSIFSLIGFLKLTSKKKKKEEKRESIFVLRMW